MVEYIEDKLYDISWWFTIKKWRFFGKRYCPYCGGMMVNKTYYIYYCTSTTEYYCFNCLKAIQEDNNTLISPSSKYSLLEYKSYHTMFKRYDPETPKIEHRRFIIKKILRNLENNRDKKDNV